VLGRNQMPPQVEQVGDSGMSIHESLRLTN
jgi:hypothetical protein